MTKLGDIFSLFSQRPAGGTLPFCVGPEKEAQFFSAPETVITSNQALSQNGGDIYSTDAVSIREYSFGYGCLREGFKILGWVDAANLQSFLKQARQTGNSEIYIQYIEDDKAEQHVTLKLEQMIDPFKRSEKDKKETALNDKPKKSRLKKKIKKEELGPPLETAGSSNDDHAPLVDRSHVGLYHIFERPGEFAEPDLKDDELFHPGDGGKDGGGGYSKTTPFEQHLKQITEKANRGDTCGPDGCHCDEPPCAPCPLDRFKAVGKSEEAWWRNFQAAIPMLGGLDNIRYYINEILTPEELSMIHFYCEEDGPSATWQISYICNSTKNAGEIERNRKHRRLRGQL